MCSKKLFYLITFEFGYGDGTEEGLQLIGGMAGWVGVVRT